jgi:hypothetical protein
MSDVFLEELDKRSWEFPERFKFKSDILYKYRLSYFFICLFCFVFYDFIQGSGLYLIEIEFDVFDRDSEIFAEFLCFFLIACDEIYHDINKKNLMY